MRATPDLSATHWRKSSYSDGQAGGECVEVCDNLPGAAPVRDSKDMSGPVLMLDAAAWQPFVDGIKDSSL